MRLEAFRRLSDEDITQDTLHTWVIDSLLPELNKFLSSVHTGFSKQLTLTDNFDAHYERVTIRQNESVQILAKTRRPVREVIIVNHEGPDLENAPYVNWRREVINGQENIVISSIAGLAANEQYVFTLKVVGD